MSYFFKPQIANKDPKIGKIITEILETFGGTIYNVDAPTLNLRTIEYGDEIKGYDVYDFINDLHDFLILYNSKTNALNDFTFMPAGVQVDMRSGSDIYAIRYQINQRTYGTVEQGAKQHTGRKSYIWQFREMLEDRRHPGYKVLVYTKPFDNTVTFYSVSTTYRNANLIANTIEDILDTYGYIFKAKGLLDLRYEGRGNDQYYEINNIQFYECPLTYYVRTYKVKLVYEKILEELVIETLIKGEQRWLNSQIYQAYILQKKTEI